MQRIGVVKHPALGVCSALPVAPHQHLATTCSTRGGDGGAVFEGDVVASEYDAPALAGQAAGIDAAAVVDHAALQLACGHGAHDHQATFGFNRLLVVQQGLPLARAHADVGELVLRIEHKFDLFTRAQGHGALGSDDQALIAHFWSQQGHIAFEPGAQFAFVDHAAGGAVALKRQVTGHEAFVADAVGGGNEAAHIDHAAAAKEHAIAVADDDLARCGDAAQDGAGLRAGHAVEGGAACVVEVHMGILAHVEAVPVEHSALAGLVDDHLGAALLDGGAAGGHAAAAGQGILGGGLGEGRCARSQRPKGQRQAAGQPADRPRARSTARTAAGGRCWRLCGGGALGFAVGAHNF